MIVTLLGVRSKLVELIPRSVMLATSAGIGLFLAFIGDSPVHATPWVCGGKRYGTQIHLGWALTVSFSPVPVLQACRPARAWV
jgi:xanthine/uracil/vitamin C permease (AzgA family)